MTGYWLACDCGNRRRKFRRNRPSYLASDTYSGVWRRCASVYFNRYAGRVWWMLVGNM
ncbi:hypothetical protein KCP69_05595 [Salmonella enterica subsp. enterica]|nr:hypothetical protein KCP69_05595 [Salmonella enterica subsp. enterica]